MTGREPYDDSFLLGPVPGGDVLFQPPGQVGQDGTGAAPPVFPSASSSAAPATAPSPPNRQVGPPPRSQPALRPHRAAPAVPPVPREYQQQHYLPHPPPPAPGRPAHWGASRVNIPPIAGPDPRARRGPGAQRAAGQVRSWTPSKGSRKGVSRAFLTLGILWLVFKIVLGLAIFISEELDKRASPAHSAPGVSALAIAPPPTTTGP